MGPRFTGPVTRSPSSEVTRAVKAGVTADIDPAVATRRGPRIPGALRGTGPSAELIPRRGIPRAQQHRTPCLPVPPPSGGRSRIAGSAIACPARRRTSPFTNPEILHGPASALPVAFRASRSSPTARTAPRRSVARTAGVPRSAPRGRRGASSRRSIHALRRLIMRTASAPAAAYPRDANSVRTNSSYGTNDPVITSGTGPRRRPPLTSMIYSRLAGQLACTDRDKRLPGTWPPTMRNLSKPDIRPIRLPPVAVGITRQAA